MTEQMRPKNSERHIVAIGGGGWLTESSPIINRYILDLAAAERPKVCFLPTASGDSLSYIEAYYREFGRYNCQPSHVTFFNRTPDLREILLNQDVIYVGGGNTKSMLAVWRDWGADKVLREAYDSGVVLAGVSAGAICWFEQGVTDSYADKLRALDCLGWLPGSCCPHYDGEKDRRPAYMDLVKSGAALDGYAIDDHVAVHFVDDEPARFIASQSACSAYWLTMQSDQTLAEIDLTAELLPKR